jgi:hypothetical protein
LQVRKKASENCGEGLLEASVSMPTRRRFHTPQGRPRQARLARDASPTRRRHARLPMRAGPLRSRARCRDPASEVRKRLCAFRLVECAIRRARYPIRAWISHFVTFWGRGLGESGAGDSLARLADR